MRQYLSRIYRGEVEEKERRRRGGGEEERRGREGHDSRPAVSRCTACDTPAEPRQAASVGRSGEVTNTGEDLKQILFKQKEIQVGNKS